MGNALQILYVFYKDCSLFDDLQSIFSPGEFHILLPVLFSKYFILHRKFIFLNSVKQTAVWFFKWWSKILVVCRLKIGFCQIYVQFLTFPFACIHCGNEKVHGFGFNWWYSQLILFVVLTGFVQWAMNPAAQSAFELPSRKAKFHSLSDTHVSGGSVSWWG